MPVRQELMDLDFQNYIERPPYDPSFLRQQSTSNDTVTVNSWRKTWIHNVQENHKLFGPFKDNGIGQLYRSNYLKPIIVAGSGPSLKYNAEHLKERDGICLISCLHNFHFFEDLGVAPDYYVTLDAGEVTIEEVSEGGKRTPEEYWEITKDRTLLAFIGSSPNLIKKWRGKILWYSCPVPDDEYSVETNKVESFRQYAGTGGNVLGASFYIAKTYLGSVVTALIGADFSFSYDKKFHSWDSKYDANIGNVIKTVDVFGNKRHTWPSYANFKAWFEWVSLKVPGIYINCTEGGILGAYPEGNIMSIRQMTLKDFITMCTMSKHVKDQSEKADIETANMVF